jgi:hypothetical protein
VESDCRYGCKKYFNSFVRIFIESVKNDGVPIIHRPFPKVTIGYRCFSLD